MMEKPRVCKISGNEVKLYLENNLLVSNLDESYDIIICDGPYGNYPGSSWGDCDWDDYDLDTKEGRDEFKDYYWTLFRSCLPRLKKHGSLFVHNYPEGASLIKSVLDDFKSKLSMKFRRWITWVYDNHYDFDQGTNFQRSHETILYYTKGEPLPGQFKDVPDTFSFPILKIEDNKFKDGAKPVEVVDYYVRPVAVPGRLLSMFGGSGTDVIVAVENNMDVTIFESNLKHVSMIVNRIRDEYREEELPDFTPDHWGAF